MKKFKFKIGRYYERLDSSRIYKCIDKEKNMYFFKRVDGKKYEEARCGEYSQSSRLCKKCTRETVCFSQMPYNNLKEIPYLKAVLLYGE